MRSGWLPLDAAACSRRTGFATSGSRSSFLFGWTAFMVETLSFGVWLKDAGHGGRKPVALHLHSAPVDRTMLGCFHGDVFIFKQLHEVLVKAVHPFVERGFDVPRQQMQIVSGDGILGARVALHNLQTGNSLLECAGDEPLANDRI